MLVALLLAAWPYSAPMPRDCRDRSCVRGRTAGGSVAPSPPAPPFTFSFAQADGIGMSSACACSGVTAVDGRPLHFDGGSAYCTKANEFSGIQPGDLVLCGADQPRIMPGGDGGGALGLQVWESKRNGLLYSQQLDNAAWLTDGVNAQVYANACVSPDGTQNAELIHFPAAGGYLYQLNCALGYDTRTVYVRAALSDAGFGDGGVMATASIYPGSGNVSAALSTTTFNSAGYTRLEQYDQSNADIGTYFLFLGNAGTDEYLCAWQADCQDNTNQSVQPYPPPILTTSAAVTRTADVPLFLSVLVPMRSNFAQSAHLVTEKGLAGDSAVVIDANNGDGINGNRLIRNSSQVQCDSELGMVSTDAYSVATLSGADDTLSCTYDGESTLSACLNGVGCGDAGIAAAVPATGQLTIGTNWNGFNYQFWANGVVKQVSITEQSSKSIYLFGDSIVEGHTAGVGHEPQYVIHNALGNAVAITNEGISGNTIPQCAAVFTAQLNIVLDAGTQARSYFMLQCGINSTYDDGGTSGGAANVLAQLETLLATAADAGVHVLGSTITPDKSQDPFVQAVDVPLRAWGKTYGIPIAETFLALQSPPDSGQLNPAYDYGDNLHPNDAGVFVESNVWISTGGW